MVVAVAGLAGPATQQRLRYTDVPPAIQRLLGPAGASEQRFDAYVSDVDAETSRRVAEGDREHLIYYALLSRRFTNRAPIEPALSARGFVEGLPLNERQRLLDDGAFVPPRGLPGDERARLTDLLAALRTGAAKAAPQSDAAQHAPLPIGSGAALAAPDARLAYFRELLQSIESPSPEVFYPDYVRGARFLYKKEFVAGQNAAEVAALYQSRPHSSDTQIDANFGVSIGLGVIHGLDPAFRVRRALVVGPGLDLAPRTDLIDRAEPQSYQPLAVADALLAQSLGSESDLRVHSIDVNPRVVRAVQGLTREGIVWHLFSGLVETPQRPLSTEYRDYVHRLGRAIGTAAKPSRDIAADRRYRHSIAVAARVAKIFSAERLNVITERLSDAPVDLIVATNVLPYFDDRQLALALVNMSAMLRSGGYLLHNETREGLAGISSAAGLPAVHMRTAILGGPSTEPLYDTIWIHQKSDGGK